MLASYSADSNWHYAFTDWLGTRRVQASSSGTVEGTYLSLPFGDNVTLTGTSGASLAALLPQNVPSILKNLAGNDLASLQQLVLGPNRSGAAVSVLEGKGTNAVAQGIGTIAWGADRFILGTSGAGTTYALDMIPGTIANSAVGAAVGTASAVKAAYDLGSYLAGFGTCAIWER